MSLLAKDEAAAIKKNTDIEVENPTSLVSPNYNWRELMRNY